MARPRPQQSRLGWPWTAFQVEALDDMLETLYKRLRRLEDETVLSPSTTLLPSGIVTIAGPPGSEGSEGPAGPDGPPGVPGPVGATGSTGPQGGTGPVGPIGLGIDGIDGVDGMGLPGPVGPTGADGIQGIPGATGPQGGLIFITEVGPDGSDGMMGPPGATGANGASGSTAWTTVKKTSDTSRNNNAGAGANVVVADPELQFAMAANTTYSIRGRIFFQINNTNLGAVLATQWNGPASPTVMMGEINRNADNLSFGTRKLDAYDTVNTGSGSGMGAQGASGTDHGIAWVDILVQNGANAGTFAFMWISQSSSANSATVYKGSYLEYMVI